MHGYFPSRIAHSSYIIGASSLSKILRQTQLTVYAQSFCNFSRTVTTSDGVKSSSYHKLPDLFQTPLLCAGKSNKMGHFSLSKKVKYFMFVGYEAGISGFSCPGDSGGPLMVFDSENKQYIQIGVVHGGACASRKLPGIFSRIEGTILDLK